MNTRGSTILRLLRCFLLFATTAIAMPLVGDNFTASGPVSFDIVKTTNGPDFSIYELRSKQRKIARIYEGNSPDFPVDRATGKPRRIGNGTLLQSTRRKQMLGFCSREHLIEFSDCQSAWRIHVSYRGLNCRQADAVGAFVLTIRWRVYA